MTSHGNTTMPPNQPRQSAHRGYPPTFPVRALACFGFALVFAGVLPGGCRSVMCDSCAPSAELMLFVRPKGADLAVAVSGPACDGETPRKVDDGIAVTIKAGGVCHLDATFPDGQQHRYDYDVTDARGDECCHSFTVNNGSFCARVADAGDGNFGCQMF